MMKTVFRWMMTAFAGVAPFAVLAQSDPGPATGGGINRSYDDGYVFVDSTGDSFGYTSNWGYQNVSQIQGNFLVFHSESSLDANTIQLITDAYDLGNLIPPPAPYSGTFGGFGSVIPDSPFSRSIQDIAVPEPSSVIMLPIGVLILISELALQKQDAEGFDCKREPIASRFDLARRTIQRIYEN
jgi:hypothetical protein